MKRIYCIRSFCLVLSLLLIAIFGCSTTKYLVQKIKPDKPDLKKRVMVLPVIDREVPGSERASQITADFVDLLRKSSHLLLYDPPKGLSWPSEIKSSRFGAVTHPELVKKAEDLGMNAIITGVLEPTQTTTNKIGIWPFRKSCRIHEVSVVMNVVDARSKALSLSRLESEVVSVPLDKAQGRNEEETIDQLLKEALARVVKRQALAVVTSLVEEPWTGRILAVKNDTIKINAGKDVGLQPGHRFEVYARGESITAQGGGSFELLGKKIGEIEATSIMEKHSLAVAAAKESFLAGQAIRFVP